MADVTYDQVTVDEAIAILRQGSGSGYVRQSCPGGPVEQVTLEVAEAEMNAASYIYWPLPQGGGPGFSVVGAETIDGEVVPGSLHVTFYYVGPQPKGAGWCAPSP